MSSTITNKESIVLFCPLFSDALSAVTGAAPQLERLIRRKGDDVHKGFPGYYERFCSEAAKRAMFVFKYICCRVLKCRVSHRVLLVATVSVGAGVVWSCSLVSPFQ